MTLVLLIVLAGLEGFALLLFGQDKAAARGGQRRISEQTLLWAGLWGGVGAWLACALLRHKTRKEPFRSWLGLAVVGHLIVVGAGVWWGCAETDLPSPSMGEGSGMGVRARFDGVWRVGRGRWSLARSL